tara:strand:- start:30675 stop:31577 length:903 start_codon:yes stop_codon:yes gene_type:complete
LAHASLDLPLWQDPASRSAPWLISLLIYVATIVFLIALTIHSLIDRWDRDTSHKLTIEIPPMTQSFDHLAAPFTEDMAAKVSQKLRDFPGIKSFRTANQAEIIKTLEPWFGDAEQIKDLPLSKLIYVQLEPGRSFDVIQLQKQLNHIYPAINVEDHFNWKTGIFNMAYAVQIISFLIVVLIFVAVIAMISYMTRTSLIIHRHIIDILHLIGAKNQYIAWQYQSHSFKLALRGTFLGVILVAITLLVFDNIMNQFDFPLITKALSSWDIWAITLIIPALVVVLMAYSAKVTALKMLRRYNF